MRTPTSNRKRDLLRARVAEELTREVRAERESNRRFHLLQQVALVPCEGTCKRGGYHRVTCAEDCDLRCDCIGFHHHGHCKHADRTASEIAQRILWLEGTASPADALTIERAVADLKQGAGLLTAFYLYTAADYSGYQPSQVRYGFLPTFFSTRFFLGLQTPGVQPSPFERAACAYWLGALLNEVRARAEAA